MSRKWDWAIECSDSSEGQGNLPFSISPWYNGKRNDERSRAMEVIGFYGPPGTGKSDRALVIAYEIRRPVLLMTAFLSITAALWQGNRPRGKKVVLKQCVEPFSGIKSRGMKCGRPSKNQPQTGAYPGHIGSYGGHHCQGSGSSYAGQVHPH